MKETKYTVVTYFNVMGDGHFKALELDLFESFDTAYNYFNTVCQELNDNAAPPKPNKAQPMRQTGRRYTIELWEVSRINNQ